MYRVGIAAIFAVAACAIGPADAVPELVTSGESAAFLERVERLTTGKIVLAACCKTCRKGKACGDSCISRSKSCRKGAGCACDG